MCGDEVKAAAGCGIAKDEKQQGEDRMEGGNEGRILADDGENLRLEKVEREEQSGLNLSRSIEASQEYELRRAQSHHLEI